MTLADARRARRSAPPARRAHLAARRSASPAFAIRQRRPRGEVPAVGAFAALDVWDAIAASCGILRVRGAVQAQYLAGVLSALVISYVGIGVSFCLQNLIDRREPTKLVFGSHSLALGACAAAVAVGRAHGRSDSYWIWTVATGADLLAVALLLHLPSCFLFRIPRLDF